MNLKNTRFSTAFAFALIFAIAASIITALPIALGQLKISMTAVVNVLPNPVGVNQSVSVRGIVYPTPLVYGDVYRNFTFTITKPDSSVVKVVHDSNEIAEHDFDYICDQIGTWRIRLTWAGDANHQSASSSTASWTVQEESVPAIKKIPTYARVATVPKDKIGLGGTMYMVGWVNPPREISGALYPNYTFTITKPNGATIKEVYYSNSEASHSVKVLCDQAGTWSVTLSYPGYIFQEGATSPPTTWEVEEGYVPPTIPKEPIPNYPWQFPISSEYYEWYQISGAWPYQTFDHASSNWNQYTKGPETPHVLWKLQTSVAGLAGGEEGAYSTSPTGQGGPAYPIEGKTGGPVAAQGRVYYARAEVDESNVGHFALYCHDQSTGELIYRRELPVDPDYKISATTSATLDFEIESQVKVDPKTGVPIPGAFSLWANGGSCMWEINPWTGSAIFFWPGRSGTYHNGAMFITNYNGTSDKSESGTMTRWSTRAKATEWTAKIPSVTLYWEDILFRRSASTGGVPIGLQIWTWNATTGEPIVDGVIHGSEVYTAEITFVAGYGKYFQHGTDGRTRAFDLYTGRLVWTSESMDMPWGAFAAYAASCGAGLVFQPSHDGYLYAYDVETGALKWRAFTENTTETAFGAYGSWSQIIIADGKVYFSVGEHSPPNPYPRGGTLYCVDLETGERKWAMEGFYTKAGTTRYGGISSGILWYSSLYDGCIYFFGRGETATTVAVQQDVVASGASVLVKGTVTDQTPAIKGTGAISDQNMEAWMQYLFRNKAEPADAVGVPVKLVAIAADGSVVDIGSTTSSSSGLYSLLWTPPAEGTYRIVASFEGSGAYYSSWGETSLAVTAAPESPPAPETAPDNTPVYFAVSTAAIIIAVAIATILLLRKR